jgi:hypothetical protein
MKLPRRDILALALAPTILSLPACGGGGDDGSDHIPVGIVPASDGRVVTMTVNSAKVGYAYPISIFIPASYDASTDAYPTIYANDGDAAFTNTSTRFDSLANVLVGRHSKAILIGIGGTVRRQTDYNFPGAYAYHDFVTLELIPAIEALYRCNPNQRMFTGLSTGGNFAATALFIEAPVKLYFSVFLSIEAAFEQQTDIVDSLEQQMYDAVGNASLPVTLILASSSLAGNNQPYVLAMYNRIAARHYQGLQLSQPEYSTDHVGTDVPAFTDAVARIFG